MGSRAAWSRSTRNFSSAFRGGAKTTTKRPACGRRRRGRRRSAAGERHGQAQEQTTRRFTPRPYRVAPQAFEVGVDEQPHEPLEVERRRPAEPLPRLRRVADEVVELGGAAAQRLVDVHVLLPVEARRARRRARRARARCGRPRSRSRSRRAPPGRASAHIART